MRKSYGARPPTSRPSPVSTRTDSSGGLAGHGPHCDDVRPEQDDRKHERGPEQRGPLSGAEPAHADAADDEGDEKDEPTGVRDDEPDVEPPRSRNAFVGPALLRGDPLGSDAHDDPARQRHGKQRAVADPQESRIAACQPEARGTG